MHTATVTSKGQITIPAEVRDQMALQPGEKVIFFKRNNGSFAIRRVGSIEELAGSLAGFEVPKSDEEMNRVIGDYLVELDEATKSHSRRISDGAAA